MDTDGHLPKEHHLLGLPNMKYKNAQTQQELCVIADLKSSPGVNCSELASEWRVLIAARCLNGSCFHLTHDSNLGHGLSIHVA